MIRVFPVGNNVPLMVFGNAFRYRKSNAKATRKGSCFVCSVKPVKEFSQFNIISVSYTHLHAVSAQFDRLDFIVCLGDWLSYASSRYDLSMLVDFMAEVSRGELPVVYLSLIHI